jgi:uncharacterized membrane protein YeaQ/YmgE (transglycosylase-associated protein family)
MLVCLVPKERSGKPMGIIAWIIIGLIAGIVAKYVVPGTGHHGIIVTTIIGIVGGLIGGFIGRLLGFHGVNGLNISSILWAIVGAVILIAIYHALVSRRV